MGRIWMSHMVSAIADLGRQYLDRPISTSVVETAQQLCEDLLSSRGEASGTALAREVVNLFRGMDESEQIAFLEMLDNNFSYDPEALHRAAEQFLRAQTEDTYIELRKFVEAPRQELLCRMNMAPGGTVAILQMRELLLRVLYDRPALKALDTDICHLFVSWFNRGFLQFERIDWHTPAAILEKLIDYEAVHEMRRCTK